MEKIVVGDMSGNVPGWGHVRECALKPLLVLLTWPGDLMLEALEDNNKHVVEILRHHI
jgi:hypothetical protein